MKRSQARGNQTGSLAVEMAVQALIRLMVLAPLLFADSLGDWARLCVLLLHILLVLPFRFRGGEALRCFACNEKIPYRFPYGSFFRTGLIRYALGLLWGLPFLLAASYLVYGWRHLPFNEMWAPVMSLAGILGREGDFGAGLLLSAVLLVLFALLFAYGWWRLMPTEYLPVRSLPAFRAVREASAIRRKGARSWPGHILTQALLSLPAIIAGAAVLLPYIKNSLPDTTEWRLLLTALVRLLQSPLPLRQALLLTAVFLLLYLPLAVFRKLRNARAVSRLLAHEEKGYAS